MPMEGKMEHDKFRETERKYADLKEKLNNGQVSPEEMKKELKKMMVLDEKGNYWMIGGKTGKWYSYNGTDWKEGNPYEVIRQAVPETPPPVQAQPAQPVSAPSIHTAPAGRYAHPVQPERAAAVESPGKETVSPIMSQYRMEPAAQREPIGVTAPTEQDITAAGERARMDTMIEDRGDRQTICAVCKSKISLFSVYCNVCGANQKEVAALSKKAPKGGKGSELVITSIKISSLLFFLGGLGLVVGVIFGAAFGIFKTILPDLPPQFPGVLADTRGGFAGGLTFAAMGGIAGFVIFAVTGALISLVYNGISFLFGGVRLRIKQ
jgi:hypothetical protein